MDDLRFIRRTMERGTAFTALPGWGGVGMGISALMAAALAARQETFDGWMAVWLVEAAVAIAIGIRAITRKARSANLTLLSGAGRKFMLSFLPPTVAGAAITGALYVSHTTGLIPGTWLLLYGVGVVTAGTFSVGIVPVMGVVFMATGGLALAAPGWGDQFMALGFGGVHILFGFVIARKYGG
jgi:hypothetical protein